MKIILASLMCGLLTTMQCLAIDGGPWGRGGGVAVTGSYAGVLVPIPVVLNPGPPPVEQIDDSLALFTLTIPSVGLASGTVGVFRNGIFYPGTASGLGDPDTLKVTALLNASFQLTVAQTSTTDFIFTYNANGKFVNAKVVQNTTGLMVSVARIRGTATITYVTDDPNSSDGNSGGPIQYRISGFKQSSASG